jgi:uncharacterized membrane protein YtjA (UPF0391 family)
MLSWVVAFVIIALIAAVLRFRGITGASIQVVKALFVIAVMLFVVSAVVTVWRAGAASDQDSRRA